eukprot:gnl/MRDRNA2_/MRDRNA2_55081_c0_seq1.p1 gnl/MRDRNA2_/MRDRNA2_55081_c0~~gnl/MRDRNA2_/MRDRNA2_55081_c0_seq1.p1  ORF type:complete len:100 (+),score=7.09 gnl/MRDRNA2_/MRDRNA2_55081_c0_seq1:57-356(+)
MKDLAKQPAILIQSPGSRMHVLAEIQACVMGRLVAITLISNAFTVETKTFSDSAILRQIRQANTILSLFHICHEHANDLSIVHVCTCWSALGKFIRADS